MKKIVTILLLLSVCLSVLLASASPEVIDVSVDLETGKASSDLIKSEFKGKNLQLTYDGERSICVALTGSLKGTLIVESSQDISLLLNGVSITGDSLPAMQLKSAVDYTLVLGNNTKNNISDSASNGKKGAITCGGNIIISGSGSLNLEVFKKHGFKTDGGLTIQGGNIYIHGDSKAEGNMVSADTWFIMNNGSLTIKAEGNVEQSESKGIKVNGVEGKDFACGYVEINGGKIDITSTGKAITAGWKSEEDGTTQTLDDDPTPDVFINGGTISIRTTLDPREDTYTNGVSNDDGLSPEGIEAKHNLYINGGTIDIVSTDDSLNSGNDLFITGGYSKLVSTMNDSVDSNSTIEISGGTVITYSMSREQAFDCDNDSNFTYTGGTFIALGNGNNIPKSSATTCCTVALGNGSFSSGDQIALLDSNKKVVLGFVVPDGISNLPCIVFGSEAIKNGSSYSIEKGKFTTTTADGLIPAGTGFTSQSVLQTLTVQNNYASSGYIGMNVGPGGDMQNMMMPGNTNAELPSKVIITEDLTAEEAQAAVSYIMEKYMNMGNMGNMGNIDNMTPPDMPNGNMGNMGNMTPPDMPNGNMGGGPQFRR